MNELVIDMLACWKITSPYLLMWCFGTEFEGIKQLKPFWLDRRIAHACVE